MNGGGGRSIGRDGVFGHRERTVGPRKVLGVEREACVLGRGIPIARSVVNPGPVHIHQRTMGYLLNFEHKPNLNRLAGVEIAVPINDVVENPGCPVIGSHTVFHILGPGGHRHKKVSVNSANDAGGAIVGKHRLDHDGVTRLQDGAGRDIEAIGRVRPRE